MAAPFTPDQLSVRIVRHVSTRYAHRHHSLAPIAGLIATQYHARPGNYLAFFSSFDYLERACGSLERLFPHIPVWQQSRKMDPTQRGAFMARFALDGRGVGFAVLGGSFAEGVDLAGTRLIGAFIATLGLPQFNPVNEELRRRLDAQFGAGYDYTYLFPGLRKVVQAAGRVIRTLSDVGSVHLIDDRFARPEVLRLLPSWWRIEIGAGPRIKSAVQAAASAASHQAFCSDERHDSDTPRHTGEPSPRARHGGRYPLVEGASSANC